MLQDSRADLIKRRRCVVKHLSSLKHRVKNNLIGGEFKMSQIGGEGTCVNVMASSSFTWYHHKDRLHRKTHMVVAHVIE